MTTARTAFIGVLIGLLVGVTFGALLERRAYSAESWTYSVEHFTPDLTIRIQCSGDCDLAEMIAEAREAVQSESSAQDKP